MINSIILSFIYSPTNVRHVKDITNQKKPVDVGKENHGMRKWFFFFALSEKALLIIYYWQKVVSSLMTDQNLWLFEFVNYLTVLQECLEVSFTKIPKRPFTETTKYMFHLWFEFIEVKKVAGANKYWSSTSRLHVPSATR